MSGFKELEKKEVNPKVNENEIKKKKAFQLNFKVSVFISGIYQNLILALVL